MSDKIDEIEVSPVCQQEPEAATGAERLKVICPHYAVCEFGKPKGKNNRHRCYGTLVEVEPEATRMTLAYKCDKTKKVMMVVITGRKVWHIKPEAVEYNWLSKMLEPQKCEHCQQRIFDAHVFMGRARIFIKCQRDSRQMQYQLVAKGRQR